MQNRPLLPWESFEFTTKSELSSHDFVSKSLSIKLINLHHTIVQAASAYPIDEGVSLYDFMERINNDEKGEYIRLLESYNFIADSSLTPLVEGVIHWKIAENEKEKARAKTQLSEKIRLLTEYLYCRILLALLRKWEAANTIDPSLSRTIVDFSLDSFTINSGVLNSEQNKALSKPKLNENRDPDCFTTYRNELQDLHANILGEVSRRCYDVVVYPFFELFKQISGNISECIEFTKAIRYVSLPCTTAEELEKSKSFIDSALQYVHKKQKIELTQAVFYLIGYALLPVTNLDLSLPSSLSFQSFIGEMYNPCKKYWKKFKDSAPAIILEIAITCNSDRSLIEKSFNSIIDKLIKYSKVPEKRFIALECLFYCIFNIVCKSPDDHNDHINYDQLIEKLLVELYHTSKKSQSSLNDESIAILVDIAHLLFYFHKKDLVFHNFVIQMLHPDFNHERITIGLKTFIAIADDLHITFDNTYIYSRRKTYTFANTVSRRNYSLKSVTAGRYQKNPLDKNLISCFQVSLEQIFRMVDSQVGNHLQYNQLRNESLAKDKDKSTLIDLLHTLITTFSRIPPVNMQTSELITVLIKYSFHIDSKICKEARILLVNLIKTRPSLRVAIVEEIGKFILSIPEDSPTLIRSSLSILTEFFTQWCDPVVIGVLEPDTENIDQSIQSRKFFQVPLFEGLGLVLLCSPYPGIRSDALKLLSSIKNLSQELPNDVCKKVDHFVIKEMKTKKEELLKMEKDPNNTFPNVVPKTESSQTYSSIRDLIVSCSKGEQEEMGHLLGKLGKFLLTKCTESLGVAFSIIFSKIEALTPTIIGKQKSNNAAFNQKREGVTPEQIILWRNYVTLALSIGSDNKAEIALEAGYIIQQEASLQKLLELSLPTLLSPSDRIRDSLHLALGYCKLPEAYSIPDSVVQLIEGYKKKEANNIRDVIRIEASHIFSMLSTNIKPDSLSSSHLKRYFDYITETLEFLNLPSNDHSWSMQHLRFDFFRVCSNVFKQGFANKLGPDIRKQLFQFTLAHCGYGPQSIEQKDREVKVKEIVIDKTKDSKASAEYETQFDLSVSLVEYWALNAVIGILSCNIDFDNDLFLEDGQIFLLLSDIFERGNQDTIELGKQALIAYLQFNADFQEQIMKFCVGKIFNSSRNISNGFFFAIVDAVTKGGDLYFSLPMLLNLSFYQMTHSELEVRRSAIELLHWMSTRFFRTQQNTFQLRMNSIIYDRYAEQLYKISLEFSERHEELRLDLLEEVMTRITTLPKKDQMRMICYISAWLSLQNLSEFDDDLVQTTLERLVIFTAHFGEKKRETIEQMWKTLAKIPENISIIFDFILKSIVSRQNTRLYVFLKICVYISEVAPKEMFQNLISGLFDKSTDEDIDIPLNQLIRTTSSQELAAQLSPRKILSWNYNEICSSEATNQLNQALTKGGFSVTVLPELVLDHFLIWKEYIPSILHATFLYSDHDNVNIFSSTKILLKNLIFQIIATQLQENSAEVKAYRQVVKIIEQSKNKPLWKKDSQTKQVELLPHIISSLSIIENLVDLWGKVALDVALTSSDNHFKIRSLQIYRIISPSPNREFVIQILSILKNFLHLRRSNEVTDISIEILTILKSIIAKSDAQTLTKIPELFWSGVALLRGNTHQEYKGAIEIISEYMEKSNFESIQTQNILVATLPTKWDPPFLGLPVYVLKGLCLSSNEEVARKFLPKLISLQLKNEITTPPPYTDNLIICSIGLLPHLLTSFGGDNSQLIASSLSEAFKYQGKASLSAILSEYAVYRNSAEGLRRFLLEVVSLLSKEFLPKYETFIFTTLLEMLNRGPSRHKKTIIRMIEAFLEQVNFKESVLIQQHITVFAPLINLLEDENWNGAIKVISLIASKSNAANSNQNLDVEKLKGILIHARNVTNGIVNIDYGTSLVVHSLRYVINPDEVKVPFLPPDSIIDISSKEEAKDNNVNANNNSGNNSSSPMERRKSFLPLPSNSVIKPSLLSKTREKKPNP